VCVVQEVRSPGVSDWCACVLAWPRGACDAASGHQAPNPTVAKNLRTIELITEGSLPLNATLQVHALRG